MRVFTYFNTVPSMPAREQSTLLDIWRRNWKAQGWEPVILTLRDAKIHPQYEELTAKFKAFPSVNPAEYELACWQRWLAMAVVGGIQTDYDVINCGFTPEMIPANDGPLVSVLADNNPCPCAVHGTAAQFDATIKLMAETKPGDNPRETGTNHWSDQGAIQSMTDKLRPHIHDICPEYRSRHWQSAPMVHYAHGATAGFDRAELMRKGAQGIRE